VGGLVVTATEVLSDQIKFIQNASGAVLGPWDCFLAIRGIETLPLRFRQHSANGLAVARALQRRSEVDKVYYPGLTTHLNHEIAAQQQRGQFGGVVSFSLKEDSQDAAHELLAELKLFKLAESLGGVKSLVCHPAQMTHASIPRQKRLESGIQDSLIRLACGIENTADLLRDLENAFSAVNSRKPVLSS
jgi:cystathionine beta-lyase